MDEVYIVGVNRINAVNSEQTISNQPNLREREDKSRIDKNCQMVVMLLTSKVKEAKNIPEATNRKIRYKAKLGTLIVIALVRRVLPCSYRMIFMMMRRNIFKQGK